MQKPAKNLKLKLNATTNGDAPAKAKTTKKPKKEAPQLTEEEVAAQRTQQMFFLRHKLQKGFLARDAPPKEDEMQTMADFFNSLEKHKDVDSKTLKETKIHKVLKAIVKLTSIPRDEDFNFKKRSMDLLTLWQPLLTGDDGKTPSKDTNGSKQADKKSEDDEDKADISMAEPVEQTDPGNDAKDEADSGTATEAKTEEVAASDVKTEKPSEPAEETKTEEKTSKPTTDGAAEPAKETTAEPEMTSSELGNAT